MHVKLNTLNLNGDTEILYLESGDLESGRLLKEALGWLESDEKRKLVLLDGGGVDHPRLVTVRFPFEETLKPFVCSHLFRPWECLGSEGTKSRISSLILSLELRVSLYRDFGIPHLMNVFSNLQASKNVRRGEALSNAFKGIPAIICGAGPSLEKNLDQLRTLENRALLFGGGSSLVPLSKAGVPFHFAVALDPEAPESRFFQMTHFEVPLFYQNQVSHPLFLQSQGAKLCWGESGSFPLEHFLGLPLSPSDVGWNVSTFATEIAYQLGCDPIIFVGMDHCVVDGKGYAGGMEELRDNPIACTDRFGNSALTRPDFLMAKQWLELFARSRSERTFLNCTEGGLALEGIKNIPLKVTSPSRDLKAKVHHAIAAASPLDLSAFPGKLEEIYESLNRCKEGLGSEDLESELFYRAHLLPTWEVWKPFIQSEEVVAAMEQPAFEKKLQQTLFLQEVTESFRNEYERKLSI